MIEEEELGYQVTGERRGQRPKNVNWPPKENVHQSPAFFNKCSTEYEKPGNIKEVQWPPMEGDVTYDEMGQPVLHYKLDNLKGSSGGQNPPTMMPLRQQVPVSQAPAPVVSTQPVVKIAAPIRQRGDSKWPPASSRPQQQQQDKQGEKPKRQHKDYTAFFSQNELPMTYPAYRAPPGTQHFSDEYGGMSDL